MPVYKISINGNVNIGVFIFANDKLCLIPQTTPQKVIDVIEEALKVHVYKVKIADTPIIGIFVAGNNRGMLLPNILNDDEIRMFKRICEENNMKMHILSSKRNALGNLILANDAAALVSMLMDDARLAEIEETLEVKHVTKGFIAGIPTVGSAAAITNKGLLLHPDTPETEIEKLAKFFNVKADVGTVNFGSSFVRSGLVVNSKGAIVGELTTGPEIMRIEQVFDITR